jgi:uncharacterized membrane protein
MSWIRRYRILNYVQSSLWLTPFVSSLLALLLLKLCREVDYATHWTVLEFGRDGVRALLAALCALVLTVIAFTFSALLITAQIASAQLSPRVIASMLRDRAVTYSITLFVCSFLFAAGVLGRTDELVLQFSSMIAVVLSLATIAMFLFLVDYWLKALRPISVIERVATAARIEIEQIYPYLVTDKFDEKRFTLQRKLGEPQRTVVQASARGVLLATDFTGLARLGQEAGGIIELVPRVGEFAAPGESLFNLYGSAAALEDGVLRARLAFGRERTIQQDPMFAFRILVDIAIKALSPAINDPTTAVLAIDQLHRLLRLIGQRRLDIEAILDESGRKGLVFRTPDWADYVALAVSEIRHYGASSMQVVRRLRALLENVRDSVPRDRWVPLTAQLQLLDAAVERSFPDARDRTVAGYADYQGVGSDDQGAGPAGASSSKPPDEA